MYMCDGIKGNFPEGRDVYGQEGYANISQGRFIEVKETYIRQNPLKVPASTSISVSAAVLS